MLPVATNPKQGYMLGQTITLKFEIKGLLVNDLFHTTLLHAYCECLDE